MFSPSRLRQFLPVLIVAVFAGIAAGAGHFSLSWSLVKTEKMREKETVLRLTDAFMTTYSSVRIAQMQNVAPVPAAYRAEAIKAYDKASPEADALKIAMVGFPGRAILTEPSDQHMESTIRAFAESSSPTAVTTEIRDGNGLTFRTAYPSVAAKDSCVACHNKLQRPEVVWQKNDIMGAFVLDSSLSGAKAKLYQQAGLAGIVIFLMTAFVGAYFFRSGAATRTISPASQHGTS